MTLAVGLEWKNGGTDVGRCHLKDFPVDNVELIVLIQTTGNFNGTEKLWVFGEPS